jgi:hypothetical protein
MNEGTILMITAVYVLNYFMIYKANRLFGNIIFIIISIATGLFTTGDEQIMSLFATIISIGKFVLDIFKFKQN